MMIITNLIIIACLVTILLDQIPSRPMDCQNQTLLRQGPSKAIMFVMFPGNSGFIIGLYIFFDEHHSGFNKSLD